MGPNVAGSRLEKEDLIPDARLRSADGDAFRHQPIAARVAEVATGAATPLNIALFGPWGSGKSSMCGLLGAELRRVGGRVRLVRYDAWKFGGAELKRNFISSAATELGFLGKDDRNRKYHGGLYESTKTARFDPLGLFRNGRWRGLLLVLVIAVAMAGSLVIALATATSAFGNNGFDDEIVRIAPGVGATVTAVLFTLLTAMRVFDGARVETDQVAPSADEQFTMLFTSLVEQARKDLRLDRLVFFIDELDRCSKEDVVVTLTSLRTFLEVDDCAFVVAADREVLEEALAEVQQATPVRESEPYYSSASAFLDKIFQHQFSLPPLRGGRLSGFARDLVIGRGGLWRDLRADETLSAVLYSLVPPHVRSPRRVKVLLNNFATNVRVSEARGVRWRERATEIAKLTVLQTEFPRLASDLHIEPRLPSLLLDPPASPSSRQRPLLERHRLRLPAQGHDDGDPAASEESSREQEPYEPPDALLVGAANHALVQQQREDLLRYLESRQRLAPDPGRDLLYLEVAGDWAGLVDPELNQLIEDEAPVRPELVVTALQEREVGERVSAARLLGQMSEKEYGPERSNVLSALAGALENLEPAEVGDAHDLLANVQAFTYEQSLQPDHLAGVLVLAVAAHEAGADLAKSILSTPDLLADADRIGRVALLLPVLDDEQSKPIEQAVAEQFLENPDVLLRVITQDPPPTVVRALQRSAVRLAKQLVPTPPPPEPAPGADATATEPPSAPSDAAVDEITVTERVDQVLAALDERGEEVGAGTAELISALLEARQGATYLACRARAPGAVKLADSTAIRNGLCLNGLLAGPATDWDFWSELLERTTNERDDWLVENALDALVQDVSSLPAEVRSQLATIVTRVLEGGALNLSSSRRPVLVASTVLAQLVANDWWISDSATAVQSSLHSVATVLAEQVDDWAEELNDALLADIRRSAPEAVAWDPDIARRFAELANSSTTAVLAAAQSAAAADHPAAPLALVPLARELQRRDEPFTQISSAQLRAAHDVASDPASLVSGWLELGPPREDVTDAMQHLRHRDSVDGALGGWAAGQAPTEIGEMLIELAASDADTGWCAALGSNADPDHATSAIAERMKTAAGSQRDRLVAALATIPLKTPASRKTVGNIAIRLLTHDGNQSKSEAASRLAVLVDGTNYQVKGRLKDAVAAADGSGHLSKPSRKRFEKLGLIGKKRLKILGISIG